MRPNKTMRNPPPGSSTTRASQAVTGERDRIAMTPAARLAPRFWPTRRDPCSPIGTMGRRPRWNGPIVLLGARRDRATLRSALWPRVGRRSRSSGGNTRPMRSDAFQLEDELLGSRYRVVADLGSGAFGRVVSAHDTSLDRDVAIKVVPVPSGQRPPVDEVLREARVASAAAPAAVVVYDVLSSPTASVS